MRAAVHQVVTFASDPFRGNPAFVLSLEQEVPDAILQRVAGQLNEGVLGSLRPTGEGRASLLFHTRAGRHPGAGHAMMAAAHVELGRNAGTRDSAVLVLSDASERVVSREGERIAVPWPIMPASAVDMVTPLGAALGDVPLDTLVAPFGYVAVFSDPDSIAALAPDMQALARLDRGAVIATAPGDQSDCVIRVFAPKLGLPEDPVCGTAHRIIAPYWAGRFKRNALHSRHLSPRGGDLWCRVDGNLVVISGEALTFLTGTIELPD